MTGIETAIKQMGVPMFIAQAKNAFFDAMLAGYARKGVKARPIARLPGSHVIEFKNGPWKVVDVYHTTVGEMSYGTTHLSFEDTPVWMMQYWGEYPEEMIATLKRALSQSYVNGFWNGGRGPEWFKDDEFEYHNVVERGSCFEVSSTGKETIVRRGEERSADGWHRYNSLWLLQL